MKLHAREIGMLKMAGFNQGKVVLYQLIQMIMLMVVSVIITCCLSLVTTPIFLTIVYRYCHIHQSVFYFNFKLFKMLGILVVCILDEEKCLFISSMILCIKLFIYSLLDII